MHPGIAPYIHLGQRSQEIDNRNNDSDKMGSECK